MVEPRHLRTTRTEALSGPFSTTSTLSYGGDLLPLLLVSLVHVPRLPVAGLVRVGPELVGASVEDLTAGLPVVDAVERAVLPYLHAQESVVQNGAPARDLGTDVLGLARGRRGLVRGR